MSEIKKDAVVVAKDPDTGHEHLARVVEDVRSGRCLIEYWTKALGRGRTESVDHVRLATDQERATLSGLVADTSDPVDVLRAELTWIDCYLDNIDPCEELGTRTIGRKVWLEVDFIKAMKRRRAVLIRRLKTRHGVDYEAEQAAERQQRDRELAEALAWMAEGLERDYPELHRRNRVKSRLAKLCTELCCEDLLVSVKGKGGLAGMFSAELIDVWEALQKEPDNPEAVFARYGLGHTDPDLLLDLMRRAGEAAP